MSRVFQIGPWDDLMDRHSDIAEAFVDFEEALTASVRDEFDIVHRRTALARAILDSRSLRQCYDCGEEVEE